MPGFQEIDMDIGKAAGLVLEAAALFAVIMTVTHVPW